MMNWYQALPNFWLPAGTFYDSARWPDFTAPDYVRLLEETLDPLDMIRFLNFGRPDRRAWGSWLNAYNKDKPLRYRPDFHGPIADRTYETARYKFLVPAWRRAITKVIQELDDIEDQVSTILWIMEWITRKIIPIPPGIMNATTRLARSLDCAEKIIAGITPFRGAKAEYGNCLREAARAKARAKAQHAGLLAWFRANWGRLLEAGQATETWFDVGIILGPIMGFIEEGLWGLAQKTVDNYLVAVDAVMPGYREDFQRNARELSEAVDRAWDETWGALEQWNNSQIERALGRLDLSENLLP
jgi:hypothetical protein